jgi:hypothetical protein
MAALAYQRDLLCTAGPTKGTTYNNNYYNFCKVNGAPISGPDACDGELV